ncbi:MAG: lipoyl(octanoyl) transferase LipB [bacterium]
MERLSVLDLGLKDYQQSWVFQERLVERRIYGQIEDSLILVEHLPVITLGRQGKEEDILASPEFLHQKKISLFRVNRGGRATFHGPGQLVAYPILDLSLDQKDIHQYIRNLEIVVIKSLGKLGIEGRSIPGYTGVWVGKKKIASIGIGVKRWITYHGLSLNVNIDLSYFSLINPCGLNENDMTSLTEILSFEVKVDTVKSLFVNSFCEVFLRIPCGWQ